MKTKDKKTRQARAKRKSQSEDCPVCGNPMLNKKGRVRFRLNGESISVPGIQHRKCTWCDEVVLDLENSRRLQEGAEAIYRKLHKLLAPDEIKAIRRQHGLTQAELAKLLRLGANTVSRWESGRFVQSAAFNTMLCMIRDIPGAVDYLKSIAHKPLKRAG